MGIGAWLLITVVGTGVLLKYSPTARSIGFQCLYLLYAHTLVGEYFHRYLLKLSRDQEQQQQQRRFDYKNISISKLFNHSNNEDNNEDNDDDTIHVHLIPFLSDNYAYVLVCRRTNTAIAVDPADPDKVHQFLVHHNNAQLTHILTTHRHADHAGGNKTLKQLYPNVEIIGAENEKVSAATRTVKDGENVEIEMSENCVLSVDCVSTPCHTSGHMVFLVQMKQSQSSQLQSQVRKSPALLFTGDHIFIGGCGAFFEGSPQKMYDSVERLKQRIRTMFPEYSETTKDDILVLCGHEYTTMCLYAILQRLPNNRAAESKYNWARERRVRGYPTVPSPWYDELQYNPYLRTDSEELRTFFDSQDPVRIMHLLYEMAKAAVSS